MHCRTKDCSLALFIVIVLALVGCADEESRRAQWYGSCRIPPPDAVLPLPFYDTLTFTLFGLREAPPNSVLVSSAGEWRLLEGTADASSISHGSASNVSVLQATCLSPGGCQNQGDPYAEHQTLFDIRVSDGDMQGNIVLKGTPDNPDNPTRYTGECRHNGATTAAGAFELSTQPLSPPDDADMSGDADLESDASDTAPPDTGPPDIALPDVPEDICFNFVQDYIQAGPIVVHQETDVDCGGDCAPCDLGQRCRLRVVGGNQFVEDDASCAVGVCSNRVCGGYQPPETIAVSGVPQAMLTRFFVVVGTTSGAALVTDDGAAINLSTGGAVVAIDTGILVSEGRFDLVVSNGALGTVQTLPNTGDGSFGAPIATTLGGNIDHLIATRWDGGDPNTGLIAFDADGGVTLHPGNGDGTFGTAIPLSTGVTYDALPQNCSGSVLFGNDQGLFELPIRSDGALTTPVPLHSTPTTGFACGLRFDYCDSSFNPSCPVAVGDVILGHAEEPKLLVLRRNSDGTFQQPVELGVAEPPLGVVANVGGRATEGSLIATLGPTTLTILYPQRVECAQGCAVSCDDATAGDGYCEIAPGIPERAWLRVDYPLEGDYELLGLVGANFYVAGPSGLATLIRGTAQ